MLHYNLAVNISVRNSNKMERISYHRIRAKTYCYGKDLALVPLLSFWQGSTTLLQPVFQGQTSFKLRGSHLKDFSHDQRDGSYSISLNLFLKIKMKHAGGGKSFKLTYVIYCGLLRLHLLGLGSSISSNNQTRAGGLFKTKRCTEYRDNSYSF
ncbi:hypothetical protein MKW94_012538 [Papaver nudicaule]|uniref:Late embryogenesis abundant protein LEA-2 subgroup domain-containing protein n=1 Tax=Papaver nudicaule TaxID=74823 RepID=A0AA41SB14_PAPNU|nr:hypothetical protein [Papaver nudicaule]